jgi:hypothetical protein
VNYVNKKNIVLIIVATLSVGGVFFLNEYRNKDSQKPLYTAEDTVITATSSSIIENTDKDSDGDGLKDWEEVLYGTNPHNPDTDGDGTSDGAEIAAGRNPLVKKTATVDDHFAALAKLGIKTGPSGLGTTTDNTLSGQFGRDIFSQYMQLQQSGNSTDQTSQQDLINGILNSDKFLLSPKVYTTADLNLVNDSSTSSLQRYAAGVENIFHTLLIQSRDETVIVQESLSKNDPSILAQIDPTIASYKKVTAALVALPTPRGIASMHLDIVNGMSGLLFVDESLRKTSVDPLVALQGMGKSTQILENFGNAIKAMKSYLDFNKVPFTL